MKSFTKILALITLTIFTSKTVSAAPIPPHKTRQSGGHYLQKRDGLSRKSVYPRSFMMMRHMRRLSSQSGVVPLLTALLIPSANDSADGLETTTGSNEDELSITALPSASSDLVDLSTSKRAEPPALEDTSETKMPTLENLSNDSEILFDSIMPTA